MGEPWPVREGAREPKALDEGSAVAAVLGEGAGERDTEAEPEPMALTDTEPLRAPEADAVGAPTVLLMRAEGEPVSLKERVASTVRVATGAVAVSGAVGLFKEATVTVTLGVGEDEGACDTDGAPEAVPGAPPLLPLTAAEMVSVAVEEGQVERLSRAEGEAQGVALGLREPLLEPEGLTVAPRDTE